MNRRRLFKAFLFVILSICSTIGINCISVRGTSNEDVKIYIASQMEKFKASINVSDYKINYLDITSIMKEIFNEHPNLFYVKDVYDYSYDSDDNVVSIDISYTDTRDNVEKMQKEYDEKVHKILSNIKDNMTDVQKVLIVHDYLALTTEYDYNGYVKKNIPYSSYTSYGAVINKKAVCLGYARAYKDILNRLGIDCEIVTSKKMNHAWNVVRIDGNFYNVDVTKDDVVYDTLGYVSHRRFLLSDKAIRNEDYSVEDTRYDASSAKYDKCFLRDVNSAILYNGGKWYYTLEGKIFTYDFGKQTSNEIYDASKKKWYVLNSKNYYASAYNKLAMSKDKILFNTSDAIYEMSFNKDIKKIYEINGKKGYIYGISFIDNDLYCHIKKKPNDEGTKIKTNINREDTTYSSKEYKESIDSIKDIGSSLDCSQEKEDKDLKDDNDKKIANTTDDNIDKDTSKNEDNKVEEIKKKFLSWINKKEDIKLSDELISMVEGNEQSLTVYYKEIPKSVTWCSSDCSVVEVDNSGKLHAVGEGTATVECKIGSTTKECIVTVQMNKIQARQIRHKVDYENNDRRKKKYLYRVPKVLTKQTCFVKKAVKMTKGYKTERICKRVLKRTSGIYL